MEGMTREETIGAVILALDLYRISLAKQLREPDMSKYPNLIEHGSLLVEGIQDMCKFFSHVEEQKVCVK